MNKQKWEMAVEEKMDALDDFIDGPYSDMHEFEPGDVRFANKVEELNRIVADLYATTFKVTK